MVNLFKGRRKSSGNAIEDLERENEKLTTPPEPVAPVTDSGGFKVLSQSDVAAKKEMAMRKAQAEKEKPRFGRFSGFGSSNNKGRQQSMDDDSPSSSKRDSKSSSGTQFSSNRPYHVGQFGSTSTLPSSADTDMNSDNMFSNLPPRPYISQHNSSPSGLSMGGMKKALPQIPQSKSPDAHTRYYASNNNENSDPGRSRALTTSSYASTAMPPKLDSDLNFGGGFDDLFSGLEKRRPSPDFVNAQGGRSLLDGKRNQPEPIRIDRKLDVEAPLASWESRGSADNLMSPTADDDDNSPLPPPVPPHKYGGQYAPVSSHSPDLNLNGSGRFEDTDAKYTRDSVISRRSTHEHSPESKPANTNPISTPHQTHSPLSTRTAPNHSTPLPLSPTSPTQEDDNMFAPSRTPQTTVRKPALPVLKENIPPPPSIPGEPNRKVLTAAEFQAQKARQSLQPREDSSDEEDYEDEEEEIRKREEEQIVLRRKQQQMQMARDTLKRTTTATPDPNRPNSFAGNGFPSEVSLNADDWSDEDVPLGVLAHHVGPKRNDMFAQLPNATPSYFPNSSPSVIDRPASAGALGNNRASSYKPVFARHLPDDPYAGGPQFIGGGLVRPSNRESMGFNNNRAQSVYGEPTGPMSYPEPTPQFPTLVGQIQMRESSRQKYMGGASSKQLPQEGPFTGALGAQMNGMNQPATRMSQMPMQNMMGMNPMMMNNGMGMMGMGQMYPQGQNPQMEQMQQMLMAQQNMIAQMQAQQYGMNGQGMPQDPRMSMYGNQMPGFNGSMNGSMPNLGSTMQNQRPMSIMSGVGNPAFQQQQRPYSTFGGPGLQPVGGFQHQPGQMHLGPPNGYTASIAPSERSNVGMSSRYRPVTTGNGFASDHLSTVSSQTLQASGGANDPKKIRGILKNRSTSTPLAPQESEEDDWSKMRSRKSKFVSTSKGTPTTASAFDDIDARAVF